MTAETRCAQNLSAIGRALAAYEQEHGELPPHLSGLFPGYLAQKEALHCPADRSPGTPRFGLPADPVIPSSYFYEMVRLPCDAHLVQLGPKRLPPKATWCERHLAQRVHFGDRVPVVTCFHHGGMDLHLSAAGSVYRSTRAWTTEVETLAVVLRRLEEDLAQGSELFTQVWLLSALDDYVSSWVGTGLPAALRQRLSGLADQLIAVCGGYTGAPRDALFTLCARLYRATGRTQEAIAASEEALHASPGHVGAAFLQADLRYRARQRRGRPPVDAWVRAEMARRQIPGLSLAMVRPGEIVLAQGYGQMNVELSVPATETTVYELASVTKPFTATAVMLLVEAGEIALDDPILKHLSGVPSHWDGVTVRHLLSHTSGIRDYFSAPGWSMGPQWSWGQERTDEEYLQLVADLPLEFSPGERWSYSNTGYILLGMLIRAVSGKPYGEFLAERVFQPLGMRDTAVVDIRGMVKNRAPGYVWEEDRLCHRRPISPTGAATCDGGLASTVLDLTKWDAALNTDAILRSSSREQTWTPARLRNGTNARYGLGWALGNLRGHRWVGHGGGRPGVSTAFQRFPDDGLTVIVLCNFSGANAGALAHRIAIDHLRLPAPIQEEPAGVSRRLRRLLLGLADGSSDLGEFTPEAHTALVPELETTRAFYQSLGPLRSFRLIEQTSDEKTRTYRYRLRMGDTPWIQTFVVAQEGEITELGIEPE